MNAGFSGAPGQALAYERFCEEEKLLIILNPGSGEASFPYSRVLMGAVYTFGGTTRQEGDTVIAAPLSAGIYKI